VVNLAVPFWFEILNYGDSTPDAVFKRWVSIKEEKTGKSLSKKIKAKIFKNTDFSLKESIEVGVLKSLENIEFDSMYHEIIQLLTNNPLSFEEILQHMNKASDRQISSELLVHYMMTLEDADYVRKTWSILRDKSYTRIIELLRQKPFTVKEITYKYNEGQSEKNKKSENTIYRYLKTLISAKIVMSGGQRVKIGKTATETLFSLTAKFFFTPDGDTTIWKSDWGKNISILIKKIFQYLPEGFDPSSDCVNKVLIDFANVIEKEKTKIVNNIDEDLIAELKGHSYWDINVAFRHAGLIMLYKKNPHAIEEIWKCFDK
jgi:DNA-binding transcriptional ArsR family regulator